MSSSSGYRRRNGSTSSAPHSREVWVRRDALPTTARDLGGAPRQQPAPPNPSLPEPHPRPTMQPATSVSRSGNGPAAAAERAVWVPRVALPAKEPGGDPRQRLAAPNPGPPEPQPQPTMLPASSSSSSSSRRRGRRPRNRGPKGEARDWAALPLDAISSILQKLDHIEILMGAGQVCRSWRHAARDEPALWRRIDMRGHADLENQVNLYGMAQAAIRRAKGQCEAFWAEYAADDDVLHFLGDEAPSLKSLCLISCQDIVEFEEEIKKFPLLEELEISLFTNIGGKSVFEEVGKACPELKHFRFNAYRFYNLSNDDSYETEDDESEVKYNKDDDAMGIASMCGLRTLQLFGNRFTNKGLTAIIDNCPHLESLDIRHCLNVNVDNALRANCARIKTVRFPNDSTDDYDLQFESPLWSLGIDSDSDDCVYAPDYILDSDEYDDYCDPFRYLNGVYESELNAEDRMFLKGMRMLMKDDSDDDDY